MTIEDLKLLVEKHHKSIIHDIEALILEYKTRPLPKTGYKYRRNIYDRNIYDKLQEKNLLSPDKLLNTTLHILSREQVDLSSTERRELLQLIVPVIYKYNQNND